MAFQSGTQIRPELANADLSGFQRAAEINAQMLAQLGQDIGGAIKAHAVKKQEAKDVKTRENIAISKGYSPDVASMYAKDPDGFLQLMEFDNRKQQHQINQIKLDSIKQNEINKTAAIKALDLAYPAVEKGQTPQFDKNAYLDTYVGFGGNDLGVAGEVLNLMQQGKDQSKLMQKVQDIMVANPDMSFTDALNYEVGLLKTATDPVTGKTSLVDVSKGTSTQLKEEDGELPEFNIEPVPQEQSIYGLGGKFTGLAESAKRTAQRATGQIGLDVASDESIQAANYIKTAESALVRAYKESSRFSATEDKRLREEFDINIGPTVDAKTLQNNLIAIDRSMDERFEEQKRIYENPKSSAKDQAAAFNIAKAIREFQSKLGIPDEAKGKSSVSVDDELSSLIEYLTEEEKQQLGL